MQARRKWIGYSNTTCKIATHQQLRGTSVTTWFPLIIFPKITCQHSDQVNNHPMSQVPPNPYHYQILLHARIKSNMSLNSFS
jgi:hypothetical protein